MHLSFIRSFYEGEEAKKNPGGWTPGFFLFGSRVLLGEVGRNLIPKRSWVSRFDACLDINAR